MYHAVGRLPMFHPFMRKFKKLRDIYFRKARNENETTSHKHAFSCILLG